VVPVDQPALRFALSHFPAPSIPGAEKVLARAGNNNRKTAILLLPAILNSFVLKRNKEFVLQKWLLEQAVGQKPPIELGGK
jgi:hypothetical protein